MHYNYRIKQCNALKLQYKTMQCTIITVEINAMYYNYTIK